MSANCPVCCEGNIVRETWPAEFEYQGVTLSSDYIEEYCDACGTALQSPKIIRENIRNKQREKNKHDGLLLGDQIRDFLDSFGMTQKLAAELFGGGQSAFAKYEADEIAHTVSMDRLLRLCLAEPKNIILLAKESNVQLPVKVVKRVNEAENEKFMAVAEAWAALEESAKEWHSNSSLCANDGIFKAYAANDHDKRKNSSEWALEEEIAA